MRSGSSGRARGWRWSRGLSAAALIFVAAAEFEGRSGGTVGAVIGFGLAAIVGALLSRGSVRLDLRTFFTATGVLLLVVAAGLLAFAVCEFQEAGVIPGADDVAFDVNATLPDDAGVGALLRALVDTRRRRRCCRSWCGSRTWSFTGALFPCPSTRAAPARPASDAEASSDSTVSQSD
jgi:high-affinity iron transporter